MGVIRFLRHGQSEANAGLPCRNLNSIALTERGRTQAECTAEAMSTIPDLIITSSALRTKQTAEPLVSKFPRAAVEEWEVQEFAYLGVPAFEGCSYIERQPLADRFWNMCDPDYRTDQTAESWSEFMRRIRGVVWKLNQRQENRIVVVTHGYVMRALIWMQRHNVTNFGRREMKLFIDHCEDLAVLNCSILLARTDTEYRMWTHSHMKWNHLAAHLRTE